MGPAPDLPSTRFCQLTSTPFPTGETTPAPVTNTRGRSPFIVPPLSLGMYDSLRNVRAFRRGAPVERTGPAAGGPVERTGGRAAPALPAGHLPACCCR